MPNPTGRESLARAEDCPVASVIFLQGVAPAALVHPELDDGGGPRYLEDDPALAEAELPPAGIRATAGAIAPALGYS